VCNTVKQALREKKYVKGDVSIRDSLNKNVSQRGLGSHRPHGTGTGVNIDVIYLLATTQRDGI
jgi:hypothetical protein